jgi:hypothetical protein
MKKIFSAHIILVFLLMACRPESLKPIGERNNYLTQLPGTYKITKVVQSDVKAVKNNWPYKTLDITNRFPFAEFELTINASTGNSGAFTTKAGNAPAVISHASGNWSVDNADAPKQIYFVSANDTVRLELGNYTSLRNNQLMLRRVRTLDGKPVIQYDYEFTKK